MHVYFFIVKNKANLPSGEIEKRQNVSNVANLSLTSFVTRVSNGTIKEIVKEKEEVRAHLNRYASAT